MEVMLKEKPVSITTNKRKRELTIGWQDGHQSVYPLWLLRAACPCATCRGGHENMRPEPDASVFDAKKTDSDENQLVKLDAVGQYAITIEWADGHHFGIYNWHFLRALCPCAICRQ